MEFHLRVSPTLHATLQQIDKDTKSVVPSHRRCSPVVKVAPLEGSDVDSNVSGAFW